jgi:RHS repeat-associated protein
MTNWTFQVGSTGSETGALTWNPNGTLNKQVINDGFNSAGSQTCTFGTASVTGYDDLGRLLSDNCGSVWAQTFSYDQYDNLSKSGSSTWNPVYNSANNRYNIGSYDSSGNILSDTFHTYTWNPYNKLSSVDSSACGTNGECITYDAFGRIVETSASGVYTELWYTQLGKTVYMHGATPSYAYWPTPGGGTVEINGNNATAYYMHKDWLGNSRISSTIVNHTVVSDQAYAPFGEVYNKLATGAGVPGQMFTGDTQDVLSGLFDTPNRELNASQGRWLSPDPAGAGWNLYAYSTNPNSRIDPSGLNDCECDYFWDDDSGDGGGGGGVGDGGDGGGDPGAGIPGAPTPVSIPGFCDASCGGSGFSGGVDANGVPNNFGPGYNMQATSPLAQLQSGVSRYLSIINTGWDPALGINWNNVNYLAQANGQYNRLSGNAANDFTSTYSLDSTTCNLSGGHCNFAFACDNWVDCGPGRHDDGLHVECAGGGYNCPEDPNTALWIHDDTVSPWTGSFSAGAFFTGNFWEHGFVDLIGGTFFVGAFPQ